MRAAWFEARDRDSLQASPSDDAQVDERLANDIGRWVIGAALGGDNEAAVLDGVCERLRAAGIDLVRVALAGDLLDPTYDGQGVRWNRGQRASQQRFLRNSGADTDEEWLRSPFYPLIAGEVDRIRRRLTAGFVRGEFPVLDELADRGGTDYVALIVRVAETMRLGDTSGVVSSWTTDAPRGFLDDELALLEAIMPAIAATFLWRTSHHAARTLIQTYLGTDAAQRVLAGNVMRGRAERIRAVVWFSDLVGFTRLADTTEPDIVLAMLNDYAEAQVESIEAHGGHVLKFIGDGMLAIFPDGEDGSACARALDAAADQRRRIDRLNARRSTAGLPVSDTHLALHIGELLYGNVGSPRRLDFTVLGPAVNEAARIEALCGSLDRPVIVSSAFAQAAGEASARLVSLGRYLLKGVARPQELYTLDPG